MTNLIPKLENAPSSLLNDVTTVPDELKSATNTDNSNTSATNANASQPGGASMEDILKGNEHTKIQSLFPSDGATASQPGGGNTVNPQSSVSVGNLVGAKTAVELMDSLLPGLLVAALYAINVKLRKSELQLTQPEKETIMPIMKQCLDTIDLNFNNPWHCLCFTIGIIYGSKVAEKGVIKYIDNLNEKREQKAAAKVVEMKDSPKPEATKQQPQPAQQARVIPQMQPKYSEAEITKEMKSKKIGRERAIINLDKRYNKAK
jgi:hypothetical protein